MKRAFAIAVIAASGLAGTSSAAVHTVAHLAPEASGRHTQYIKTGVRLTGDDRKTCTVELWVRPLSFASDHHLAEMYSGNAGRQNFMCRTDGKIIVWMGGYDNASIVSASAIPLDRWSHIAWVADGDVWRLYINGKLDAESSGHAGHLLDGNAPDGFVIGNSSPTVNLNGHSNAYFAEVRVWKCARTAEQIASVMGKRLADAWMITDLVGYWPLSDGVAAFAKNGNRVANHAVVPIAESTPASQVADDMNWPSAGNYADGCRVDWVESELPVYGSVSECTAIYNLGGHTPPDWGDKGCHTHAVNTRVAESAEDFTLMGWYLISDSSSDRSLNCLFAKARGLNGDTALYECAGKLTLSMIGRTPTGSWASESVVAIENAIREHIWTHLAIVKRGTTLSFYINGELKARQEGWSLTMPAANLHIGGTDQWGGRSFFGAFKNIGLWRKAMTERSIAQYMRCLPDAEDSDLIGYWPMDDGSGDSARNLKDSSLPAVPVGSASFFWLRRAKIPRVDGAFKPLGMSVIVR